MRNSLGKGESLLFGHFVIIEVGALSKEHALELSIKSANCSLEEAGRAWNLAGHPYYLIMLAENHKLGESYEETYKKDFDTHI